MDFSKKTNSEIQMEIQLLKQKFEAIKLIILSKYDELENIEKEYNEANKEILRRLKGSNGK